MATSQAANLAEKAMGHTGDATTEQDVSNPARDREKYADPSGEKMKALVWMGKKDVQVGEQSLSWMSFVLFSNGLWHSRDIQTKSHRGHRRDSEGHWKHCLWK